MQEGEDQEARIEQLERELRELRTRRSSSAALWVIAAVVVLGAIVAAGVFFTSRASDRACAEYRAAARQAADELIAEFAALSPGPGGEDTSLSELEVLRRVTVRSYFNDESDEVDGLGRPDDCTAP